MSESLLSLDLLRSLLLLEYLLLFESLLLLTLEPLLLDDTDRELLLCFFIDSSHLTSDCYFINFGDINSPGSFVSSWIYTPFL